MNKKETDRAINYWVLSCIFGPASVLSLTSFVVGYHWPNAIASLQTIAQGLGLRNLVTLRTIGTEFYSAAYLYWLAFWMTLPLNLIWAYVMGVRQNLFTALRTVARTNLNSGVWDPQKYTLRGGRVRFFLFVLLTVSIFLVQLISAHEPSYCKGCEKSSILGFILLNWLGTHLLLIAIYFAGLYFVLWPSIHRSGREIQNSAAPGRASASTEQESMD